MLTRYCFLDENDEVQMPHLLELLHNSGLDVITLAESSDTAEGGNYNNMIFGEVSINNSFDTVDVSTLQSTVREFADAVTEPERAHKEEIERGTRWKQSKPEMWKKNIEKKIAMTTKNLE